GRSDGAWTPRAPGAGAQVAQSQHGDRARRGGLDYVAPAARRGKAVVWISFRASDGGGIGHGDSRDGIVAERGRFGFVAEAGSLGIDRRAQPRRITAANLGADWSAFYRHRDACRGGHHGGKLPRNSGPMARRSFASGFVLATRDSNRRGSPPHARS